MGVNNVSNYKTKNKKKCIHLFSFFFFFGKDMKCDKSLKYGVFYGPFIFLLVLDLSHQDRKHRYYLI